MKSRFRCLLAVLAVMGLFSPLGASAQPPDRIVIGLIPEMNVFQQMERYRPLAEYLSEQIGVKVQLTILSRYGNIIDSFASQEISGAFFGSFTGALAIEKLGVVPLVRPVNPNGESTYCGYIYTRNETGIRTAADMKNKRFAFVDKATTAGYVFPLAYLKENGVRKLDGYFKENFFSGSHDASLHAVLEGKADVGASKNTVFERVRKDDPRVDREIQIIARSPHVPSNGLCVRKTLDATIQRKLKEVLLAMDGSPRGRETLQKLGARKFIETRVEDYQPVIEMAKQAGIDLNRYDYRND